MTAHPYKSQPSHAFWSRSVSESFDARKLVPGDVTLLRRADKIATLGSCFASNLVPYLRERGFHYVVKEERHPLFRSAAIDNFSYDKFSAAYGNIYTARQFRQLLDRALGRFHPQEDRWATDEGIVDPFRPGLLYRARSHVEFDCLTQQHLSRVREVFREADVVIFTLGLTEAWISSLDGAVFPACPGTVAGVFDPERHMFYNFTVNEIVDDLAVIRETIRELNPHSRMILTVSPVPLVATATNQHVLVASTYSKSVLRVACGEFCAKLHDAIYFPSYEIITGPQAPEAFFEDDRRNASKVGIDQVMAAFLAHCDSPSEAKPIAAAATQSAAEDASALVSRYDCEEAAADR
jgi:hypothetical protein